MIENILPNKAQFDTMNGLLSVIANNSYLSTEITDFKTIQKIVRLGLAKKHFSVGDRLSVNRKAENGTVKTLVFEVVDFDKYQPVDTNLTHSMTLMLRDGAFVNMKYDYQEALYYAENGLSAGTYNVTISGNTYQFVLTSNVPSGGQLVIENSVNSNITAFLISSYQSASSTTPIESGITLSLGSEGTSLSTNTYNLYKFGSADYARSYVRKWLNSEAQANAFWSPNNLYSHKPNVNYNGFLCGMDGDFLSAIGRVKVPLFYNGGGTNTYLEDLAFLPSASEMGLNYYRNFDNSEMFELNKKLLNNTYSDTSNAARIKYSHESYGDVARTYLTRNSQSSTNLNVVCIYFDGKTHFSAGAYDGTFFPCVNIV